MRYSDAGVDLDGAGRALEGMRYWMDQTLDACRILVPPGYFAGVFEVDGVGIAACTDGVGSKVEVARLIGDYSGLGADVVAANANDLVCVGARPVAFMDYVAVGRLDHDALATIALGMSTACIAAGMAIVGGEISQLPGTVSGLDLVGSAIGTVPPQHVNFGAAVERGDVVVGLPSSGPHCNGFSLIRRALGDRVTDHADELLRPTELYSPRVLAAFRELGPDLRAAVHVTGRGLHNLTRVAADVGFVLDNLPKPQPIFRAVQAAGDVPDAEAYRVLNMGVGFCVVVAPHALHRAIGILRPARVIGRVVDGGGVHIA